VNILPAGKYHSRMTQLRRLQPAVQRPPSNMGADMRSEIMRSALSGGGFRGLGDYCGGRGERIVGGILAAGAAASSIANSAAGSGSEAAKRSHRAGGIFQTGAGFNEMICNQTQGQIDGSTSAGQGNAEMDALWAQRQAELEGQLAAERRSNEIKLHEQSAKTNRTLLYVGGGVAAVALVAILLR